MNCCATEPRQRTNGRRAMDWAYLLNSFEGRISRQPFWIAMAVITVAEIFCHVIAESLQGDRLSAIVDLERFRNDVAENLGNRNFLPRHCGIAPGRSP